MESYWEVVFERIAKRWPQLAGSQEGEFYEGLHALLKVEEGHEVATAMCRAVIDGCDKLVAGDVEEAMKLIMPIIQDVGIYDALRYTALHHAILYGGVDDDPTSELWRCPEEAAYFDQFVPPLWDLGDELDPPSDSPSSTGMPTPSESDCTVADEEITSEHALETPVSTTKPSTSNVIPEEYSSSTDAANPYTVQQLTKGLNGLTRSLSNNMKACHTWTQMEIMNRFQQEIHPIRADCKLQLEHVSAIRTMMTETVGLLKDELKTLKEQSKSSSTIPDAKQIVASEGAVASTTFESIDPECRKWRMQIYHTRLAICSNHDTAKFKPGILGDCCASSISGRAGRETEAKIEGHMILADRHRDAAQRKVPAVQKSEYGREVREHMGEERSNLAEVLTLLIELIH